MGMFDETLEQEFKRYSELEECREYLEARMTEIEQQVLLALASGGAGGLAGKFLEYSCDAGKRFLGGYFRDHGEAITKAGEDNFTNYLTELIKEVRKLESDHKIFEERFNETLNQPSFAVLLQKSVISSAKTGSREKHKILANLIAERLLHKEESTFSLGAEDICETVTKLNYHHFKILELYACFNALRVDPYIKNLRILREGEIYIGNEHLIDKLLRLKNKINIKEEHENSLLETNQNLWYLNAKGCLTYKQSLSQNELQEHIFNEKVRKNLNLDWPQIGEICRSEKYLELSQFFYGALMQNYWVSWTGLRIASFLPVEPPPESSSYVVAKPFS